MQESGNYEKKKAYNYKYYNNVSNFLWLILTFSARSRVVRYVSSWIDHVSEFWKLGYNNC